MSNGYIYDHAYDWTTDSTPTWAEHILHSSVRANINALVSWGIGIEARAAFAVGSPYGGVQIINLYDHSLVAYAYFGGVGFSCIDRLSVGNDVYLYLGRQGGVYRLKIVDAGVEQTGNIAPSPWNPVYSTTSYPPLPYSLVKDLQVYSNVDTNFLAVITGGVTTDRISIINVGAGTIINSKLNETIITPPTFGDLFPTRFEKFIKPALDSGNGDGSLYATADNLLYYFSNLENLSDDFKPDNFYGSISDNFDDNCFDNKWFHFACGSPFHTTSESSGKIIIHLGVTDFGQGAAVSRYRLPKDENFDIQTDFSNFNTNIPTSGFQGVFLGVINEDNSNNLSVLRFMDSDSNNAFLSTIDNSDSDPTPTICSSGKFRIIRSGSNVLLKAYDGNTSTWIDLSSASNWSPISSLTIVLSAIQSQDEQIWDYYFDNFIENAPPNHRNLPGINEAGQLQQIWDGKWTKDTSSQGTNTIFLAFCSEFEEPSGTSGGVRVIDTDETSPGVNEKNCAIYGALWDSAALTCTALAVDPGSSPISGTIYIGIGTIVNAGQGIKIMDISTGFITYTFDSSGSTYNPGGGPEARNQPLIGNCISCLTSRGLTPMPFDRYLIYGTTNYGMESACGAGLLKPHSTPPGNGNAYIEPLNEDEVLIGCTKPGDSDYLDSTLERRKNEGVYALLKTDDFGGSGSLVRFSPDNQGRLAYFDYSISENGKYEYRWKHRDQSWNESAGTAPDPAYIDEPLITEFDPGAGSSITTDQGINIYCRADSGDNSGHAADQVEYVQFREAPRNWNNYPRQEYDISQHNYPFVLSPGSGLKLIEGKAISKSGLESPVASGSIVLRSSSGISFGADPGRMVIFHDFESDFALWLCNNDDPDFPISNVKDDRLGVIWRADALMTTYIQCDLGSAKSVKLAGIWGHNFAEIDVLGSIQVHFGYSQTNGFESFTWQNMTSQIYHKEILWRPNPIQSEFEGVGAFRYWSIKLEGAGWATIKPIIGRIVFALTNWQPQKNFSEPIVLGRNDPSDVVITEAGAIVSLPKTQNDFVELQFALAPETLQDEAMDLFAQVGRIKSVAALLMPSRIPCGGQPLIQLNREKMAVYGYLDSDMRILRGTNNFGAVSMKIREIVG